MKRVQFEIADDEALLCEAWSRDRGIPLHDLARSALLSAMKRDVGKGHLLDAVRVIVREEIVNYHEPPEVQF